MEKDMMLAYGDRRRRKRQSEEEVDGEMLGTSGKNLAELSDAVEDRDLWRNVTMTIARALRVDSAR